MRTKKLDQLTKDRRAVAAADREEKRHEAYGFFGRECTSIDQLNLWLFCTDIPAATKAFVRLQPPAIANASEKDQQAWTIAQLDASRSRVRDLIEGIWKRKTTVVASFCTLYNCQPHVGFAPRSVSAAPGSIKLVWVPGPYHEAPPPCDPDGTSLMPIIPREEVFAAIAVLELADKGLLFQLRDCKTCNRLFLPYREKDENCGSLCSRRAYAKSPQAKAKRNAAARKRYQETFHPEAARTKPRGKPSRQQSR